jgi:hypothetical protein
MLKNEKKKGEILIKEAPENFKLQDTTIWSFLERGNWATHSGKYRGNWSPYIPRNIILRYSKKKDWILDQFLGSGTTLILLCRKHLAMVSCLQNLMVMLWNMN